MRYLAALVLCCVLSESHSQGSALFRIITFSDGVTVDGAEVKAGQFVKSTATTLEIPGGGYCGVLSTDGFLLEIRKSISVAQVNDYISKNVLVHDREGPTTRPYPPPFRLPLIEGRMKNAVFGDFLYLVWWENGKNERLAGIEYEVKITNTDDKEIEKLKVVHNWVMLDAKKYFAVVDPFVVSVRSGKTRSQTSFLITRNDPDQEKLKNDLLRVTDQNDLAMRAAVFELNGYIHDRNFMLHDIMETKYQPSYMLKEYVDRLVTGLDLK